MSEVFHYAGGPFNATGENPRVRGHYPEGRSYFSFASFQAPTWSNRKRKQAKRRKKKARDMFHGWETLARIGVLSKRMISPAGGIELDKPDATVFPCRDVKSQEGALGPEIEDEAVTPAWNRSVWPAPPRSGN